MVMMIAFITLNSLVPLIEGLCSSDSISIRDLGFTLTYFALLFGKEKYVQEKSQSSSTTKEQWQR